MKPASSRRRLGLASVLALGLAVSVSFWACSNDGPDQLARPDVSTGIEMGLAHPKIQAAMKVQESHTPDLMKIPGVVGTAVGVDGNGDGVLQVFLEEDLPAGKLPAQIEGHPLEVVVTGKLIAMKGGGGGGSGTAKQTPPIKMGTTGGWRYDLANGYCCGGTLGSLVRNGGTKYILSNYHVLYADIVNGGNGRTAQPGDPVIHPGLIDVACNAANAFNVGTLVSGGGSLPGGNVDAGIAAVTAGQVDATGAILNIGTISATTQAASVGQMVKKMGRTTGLTRSTVSGLNATVQITYSNECAGGTSFTKTFTGQIVIANSRCRFQAGGDSGSLLVQDVTTNPRAIGLCFAGSSVCSGGAIAIANPINAVLSYFGPGFTMVGQ
jgi:hypothetical protein